MAVRVYVSALAADRLAQANAFIGGFPPGTPVLIVGATRGAADDLARRVAAEAPATFGIRRLSLTQLAARTAMVSLAGRGMTPSTHLGAEAVAARVVFDAARDGSLRYFSRVTGTPGFPRALARTLQELRLGGIAARSLSGLPLAGADLAAFLDRFDERFDAAGVADRAELLDTAAALLRESPVAAAAVLLDVPLDHGAVRRLVEALIATVPAALATVPDADRVALHHFESIGAAIDRHAETGSGDLALLRRFLFSSEAPPRQRALDGSLEFFSAPGEGREAVEIARRVLKEARAGVRFDEMAILVRSPHSYFGLLEHALRRANVPAWFDRGTRRPHPAGRAFLALLACAAERLSASRFSEYLSLGQVPQGATGASWAASHDDAFGRASDVPEDERDIERNATAAAPADEAAAVVAGTLRAPWQWEKLLVESAVIGQTAARWERRLTGMAHELELQKAEAARQEGDDTGKVIGLQQMLDQLEHLRAFALPLVTELSQWPASATWGEWLDRFQALAPRVLRMPSYVLRVLADLRPMAEVGPVDLDEARRVLSERLLMLESEPPSRRFGRVFVGTPQQARGRTFRVVFVPGLAERMFPQKPREDPLLLDALRERVDAAHESLPTQRQRLNAERLLLQLAAGAASERLYVSYPRIELSESRARVPSFYALDVMRAATGRVPDHEALEERARMAGNATLAWPAPPRPDDAIDDQEHDLAVLRTLLDEKHPHAVKGHAHYLLKLNECLRRSVIDRWSRGERRWSVNDGLTRVTTATREPLAERRLTARSYSLSALQRFSACPYQFVLAAMYRLQPLEQPEPLQRLDPMTRGSIFHDVQARFFRALRARDGLPVTTETLDAAHALLDSVADDVAAREHERLAPAVERVWDDEVASLRRDLHAWLDYAALDGGEWVPKYFEFGFGRVPGERDAASVAEDVTLAGRFKLRGAIDLIEEHRQTGVLRVTDHKTGRKPDRLEKAVIAGGAILQPVLYALAVEAALQRVVSYGRLFYCTSVGSFTSHPIPLNATTRAAGLEVLQIVDRAIESGFLAAAPTEEACHRCDFRCVCGPDVARRVTRKPQDKLQDLHELRSRP
jgi:CRISPR/Cas system-associated exonuclease Cas4 (RecB family)